MSDSKLELVLTEGAATHIEEQDIQRAVQGDRGCVCHLCESRELLTAAAEAVEALGRVRALVDQWNETPDHNATNYDRGRVEQRRAMTIQMLEITEPKP